MPSGQKAKDLCCATKRRKVTDLVVLAFFDHRSLFFLVDHRNTVPDFFHLEELTASIWKHV